MFDRQVFENFNKMQKTKATKISGHCTTYNNVEEVWRFTLKNMEIKDEHFKESSDYCLLFSMNAKNNPVEPCQVENTRKGRTG